MKLRWELTLYQKGLLVIFVPVVLQLGLLVWYAKLLQQSEQLVEQEYHSKEVIGRCNWIGTLTATTALSAIVYAASNNPDSKTTYEYGKETLPKDLAGVTHSFADNVEQLQRANEAFKLINQVMLQLDDLVKDPSQLSDKEKFAEKVKSELVPTWQKLYNLRHQLLTGENIAYKTNVEALPMARLRQKEAVMAGVVLTIIIAVGLSYAFSTGLIDRLSVLSDNAFRFTKRQPLNAPLPGADEVASLDKVFHQMVALVQQSEQRKQEYLSMISHDLRSPLTATLGSLEIVTSGKCGELTEAMDESLKRANRNVNSVLKLINELLELERMESGLLDLNLGIATISEVIEAAIDSVTGLAEKRNISITVSGDDVEARFDQDQIIRVLVNLLSNAIKYSQDDSKIEVQIINASDQFGIKIKDYGRGIPASQLDKVFDRFWQVNPNDPREKSGSGLGLAICKSIVESHQGKIKVESETGKGCVFSLFIPKRWPADQSIENS